MRWTLLLGLAVFGVGCGTSAGAVFDFSPPLQNVEVTQAGGTVSYRVFDPARGTFVGDTDSTGSVFILTNWNGVVAWNNGSSNFFRAYDPAQGRWAKTNVNSGGTFDLQTAHGVVIWSSGAVVSLFVYDAARRTWIGASVSSGSPFRLQTAHGLAAWTSGTVVYYLAYDPVRAQWVGNGINAGGTVSDLTMGEGVVAWSSGNVISLWTYDPVRAAWLGGDVGSGNTFDLKVGDGVVAWSHLSTIYYYAYDPVRGNWQGSSTASGQTFNLSIVNGTVFWNASNINYTRGYNVGTGTWAAALTVPFAAFGVSTNAGNAPLPVWFFDMSLGASSWSWNFGDGEVSVRRDPYHVFSTFARNGVTLTVAGPGGGNSSTNLTVLSDVSPPAGTVSINNGAEFTTNLPVTLTLSATDNSGVVATMRFSNDNSTWSDWEPFTTVKAWTLTAGNGTKTVYVQFRDAALNAAASASDTILLDTTLPPTALFEAGTFNVGESTNTLVVRVLLSGSFTRQVSVDCFTVDGSALSGSDYVAASNRLVFPPGVTNQSFPVSILNDTQVEPNETVLLQLANPTNAVAGPAATLVILDDDPAQVSFVASQYSAVENAGTASVTVQLNAVSGQTVTVRYLATNGTATPNLDYVAVSGTVTFDAAQTVQSFLVPLLDDVRDEPAETVSLTLFQPVGAVLGPLTSAVLTLQDNDPPEASFARPAWVASEGQGSATLQVVLSTPFTETIFVDYATSNGTARAGSDYVNSTGTLIFGPGQTNKPLVVTLLNDATPESPETVFVVLTGALPGTLGPQYESTLTVEDDDVPRLGNPQVTSQGQFQASITGPAGQRLTVETSVNLIEWTSLLDLTNTAGTVGFIDPNAAHLPARFYRVRLESQ